MYAQNDGREGEVFVSNNFNGTTPSIHVKWISKHVYFPEGAFVYRKQSGSNDWVKLNTSPISLKQSPVNNGASFDEDTKKLYNAIKKIKYSEFKSNMVRAFITIKAIYNNDLAQTMGMAYEDKTAQLNQTYSYKVKGVENGTEMEVGISKEIKCEAYSKIESPLDIVVDRQRLRIDFVWKPELLRYYGVDIYRKSNLETEFTKITKVPRAVQKIENREGEITFPKVFFSDLEFDKKLSYEYKLVAIDYFGNESQESKLIEAFVKDFGPPTPVSGLKIFPDAKNLIVQLNWEASSSEDTYGYNIYRSTKLDGPYQKITDEPVVELEYYDEIGRAGGYYYYVAAIDFSRNEGNSGKVFMDLKDIIPPSAPLGFKSVADTGMIKLSWKPNSEKDLKGYFIQRSLNDKDNSDNKYININSDPIVETSFTQKMAKNIKNKFVYRVVAIDSSYNFSKPSINSLAQMPDIVAPAVPVIEGTTTSYLGFYNTTYANGRGGRLGFNTAANIDLTLENEILNGNVEVTTLGSGNLNVTNGDVDIEDGKIKEYGNELLPRGAIILWSGTTAPAGWALCDGGSYPREDGGGNVTVPNLRGRFVVGYNSSDADYNAIGDNGGAKEVTLNSTQVPDHTHSGTALSDGAHTHTFDDILRTTSNLCASTGCSNSTGNSGTTNTPNTTDLDGAHTHSLSINSTTGGGGAHENRPPYYTLAYIYKL